MVNFLPQVEMEKLKMQNVKNRLSHFIFYILNFEFFNGI